MGWIIKQYEENGYKLKIEKTDKGYIVKAITPNGKVDKGFEYLFQAMDFYAGYKVKALRGEK